MEELLARADSLVIQQKEPDVHVYEAMAESLGTAWKELSRQLDMRGFLLTETKRFYKLAKHHEEVCFHFFQFLNFFLKWSTTNSEDIFLS